jgi:hypothetical protein
MNEQIVVVIVQDGETARLKCATLEEAQQIRQSFVNYGKCQEITIEVTPIGVD